jgi:hypothetical protein
MSAHAKRKAPPRDDCAKYRAIQLGLSHRLEADFPPSEARAASLRLHASIRRQLKDGATDALSIATESESGTLKPQES